MVFQKPQAQSEDRGFAIYVTVPDGAPRHLEISLEQLAVSIQNQITATVPNALISSSLNAVRPTGGAAVAGFDLPVSARHGVVIDISRQRVLIDGRVARVTFREFRLLSHLVQKAGTTVSRIELAAAESTAGEPVQPRTVDVHIKRLRMKLEPYRDILRTERGAGYRFDRHADVVILTEG